MRRISFRATGSTGVLTVAIACAATLATASPVNSALDGRHAPPATAQESCSMATALRVGKRFFYDPGMRKPINQLLCGSFTGPGSEAMVIAFTFPVCWPVQRWAVFQYTPGQWQLVLDQPSYVIPPLAAVGSDIRETAAVHRRGDPRCIPSGGTRARTWRWDGTRLVAGPWKQVKPPANPPPTPPAGPWPGFGNFKSPSGNIVCIYNTRGSPAAVECGIKTGLKPMPPYTAECRRLRLDHNADRIRLKASGGRPIPPACSGDAGPFTPGARVLAYGKTWSGRGLSCRSAFTGMTCRNTRGHGFFLSRARWRTF